MSRLTAPPTTMTSTNPEQKTKKKKTGSVMDAASALTSLGDEESEQGSRPGSPSNENNNDSENAAAKESDKTEIAVKKESSDDEKDEGDEKGPRYLPDNKKPDAALTFPEKLMKLMIFADKQEDKENYCVAWMEDGKTFIIRNPDEFTRKVVPKFFKATKFSSFTRKLYRWGFRQVNRGIGPDDPIIFGNENFQRDKMELMANMRSITAAGQRKNEQKQQEQNFAPVQGMAGMMPGMMFPAQAYTQMTGMKHSLDGTFDEGMHKRMMMEHLYQQQKGAGMAGPPFGGMNSGASLSLTSALRPNMPAGGMTGGFGGPGPNANANMMMNGAGGPQGMGFDMMMNNGAGQMNQFMPQGRTMNGPPGNNGGNMGQAGGNQSYPNPSSTAEIVNAAIAALRYSN